MEEAEKFKELIVQHLGRKMKSKHKEVLFNMLIVDDGIKPAYLFDCGAVQLNSLLNLVQDMYKLNLINNKLKIFVVDLDYLIINPKCVLHLLTENNFIQRCVDVSANLQTPEIVKDNSVICSVRETIQEADLHTDSIECVKISDHSCNVTSLFGLLLGYPVIYWFDTSDGKSENCLSMEPLRVFEIRGHFKKNGKDESIKYHQIYSFSVPECLLHELQSGISDWFTNLKDSSKWTKLFVDIDMIEKTVILPVVSM